MEEALVKKVMPHSSEAEKAVLGSIMMDAENVVAASEIITGEDFYQRQNGILFDALVELYNAGKPIDLLTIKEHLKTKDAPEEMFSIDYISGIMEGVVVSVNARSYAEIVYEKSMLRKLIKASEDVGNMCYSESDTLENIMETTEKSMFGLLQKRTMNNAVDIGTVVLDVIANIEKAAQNSGSVTGIATGFHDLDYKTAGLQNSDLILVAARPSMGKTAFVLNLAHYISVRHKIPIVMFSLEMSRNQLVNRMLSMEANIDAQKMRVGNLNTDEWDSIVNGAGEISGSPFIIDDTPGISITELRSKCRKYKLEKDIKLVVIDYLQLMSGGKRTDSRQQEISEISRALKALARELNVPVIALSQLSRAVEQRPDKRPILSDLRESGAIEQDADVVMFLYRDEYYNRDSEEKGVAEVIIAKQRNGPTGISKLAWVSQYTKFANLDRKNYSK